MEPNSIDLQLQVADMMIELDGRKDIPVKMIKEYFKIANLDNAYVGFKNYKETVIVKQLMVYYTDKADNEIGGISGYFSSFESIIRKIYECDSLIETPIELYIKIFEYAIAKRQDNVIAAKILGEAEIIADKSNNIVLKIEIKRLLLQLYLRSPNKFQKEIKSMSSQLKVLNATDITPNEISIKGFL